MEVNKIEYTPNFRGYKNIITKNVSNRQSPIKFAYMSMQLDNVGTNDLEKWLDIQRKVLKRTEPSDVLTISALNTPYTRKYFWLGDKDLHIPYREKAKSYSSEEYEKFGAYSFVAQLLTRLMNDNGQLRKDSNLTQVAYQAAEDLHDGIFAGTDIIKFKSPKDLTVNLINNSFLMEDAPQENAGVFNRYIHGLMEKHF